MKMIDRFMYFVTDCSKYQNTKSPIIYWKAKWTKYQILKELKSKDFFTVDDLCNYGWVIEYATKKWKDSVYDIDSELFLPRFRVSGIEGFYSYTFRKAHDHHLLFGLISKARKSSKCIILSLFDDDNRSIITELDCIYLNGEIESNPAKIIKEELIFTINYILSKLLKGD